ncbi:MAG: Uma2 family endonuclease [Okeania sp. SIO2D1]|nr:Uma2 family endonuclease [Okeania sp. SIO2D1]
MTPPIPQTQTPPPPRDTLPTMYDLPSENPEEPGLPDEFHFLQPLLLYLTFQPLNWSKELVYSAVDMNLYYTLENPQWYKRPDWFGVVGVPNLYQEKDLRLSYVTWQEAANPSVVVELLSPGTEKEDFGETTSLPGQPPTKWEVYEQILKIPYYVIFSRYSNEVKVFHLVEGKYQEMEAKGEPWLMPEVGLSLGLWQGEFEEKERLWLRWFSLDGELIPIAQEEVEVAQQEALEANQRADSAEQRADSAEQRADSAQQEAVEANQRADSAQQEVVEANQRAAALAEKLKELGINPDEIG